MNENVGIDEISNENTERNDVFNKGAVDTNNNNQDIDTDNGLSENNQVSNDIAGNVETANQVSDAGINVQGKADDSVINQKNQNNAVGSENSIANGDGMGYKGEEWKILSGPVEIMPPLNANAEQIKQVKLYIEGANKALREGYISPIGRVSTKGSLRDEASDAAAQERARALAAGTPYSGHVGHVPDTTWTGTAQPHSWLDSDPSVNSSIGGQANRYPLGYKPTEFVYKKR